jgi:tetratricopeptide (TPR) repeat protein
MRSCILPVYLTIFAIGTVATPVIAAVREAPGLAVQASPTGDPQALYAQREDPAKARRAADLWAAALKQNPKSYETAWKLAMARYWLGNHVPEAERKQQYEAGIEAAKTAIAVEPNKVEGHFWMSANTGMMAESFGIMAGLKYRKPVREEAEKAIKIDGSYRQGSAYRILGRWYFKVPGLFGGNKDKSVENLNKALSYNPNSTVANYFLGETLLDMGKKAEARTALKKVIDAPLDPEFGPEDKDWKAAANKLLPTIK